MHSKMQISTPWQFAPLPYMVMICKIPVKSQIPRKNPVKKPCKVSGANEKTMCFYMVHRHMGKSLLICDDMYLGLLLSFICSAPLLLYLIFQLINVASNDLYGKSKQNKIVCITFEKI